MGTNTDGTVRLLPALTDDMVFSCLSPANLIAYSRTCRYIREAVQSFYRRAFRIEYTLRKYFMPKEVVRFRELQESTGLIVSGSVALEFFDRTEYDSSNLDLYVDYRFRQPIALWLQSIGYKYLPRVATGPKTLKKALKYTPALLHDGSYFEGIFALDFSKGSHLPKVRLFTTSASPLEKVLRSHSTCVMNLITHDKAYSIFPRATFENRRSLMFVKDDDSTVKAREKYEERGWTFVKRFEIEQHDLFSGFGKGIRRLGDSKCWSISLDPDQDRKKSTWESNSWKLVYGDSLTPTPMNIWLLFDNPDIYRFTYLMNHTLARRLRRDLMTIGYEEGEYTDFYSFMMEMMSR